MPFRSPRMIPNGEGYPGVLLRKRSPGERLRRNQSMLPSIWMQPLLFPYWSVGPFKREGFVGKERDAGLYGMGISSNPFSSFNPSCVSIKNHYSVPQIRLVHPKFKISFSSGVMDSLPAAGRGQVKCQYKKALKSIEYKNSCPPAGRLDP